MFPIKVSCSQNIFAFFKWLFFKQQRWKGSKSTNFSCLDESDEIIACNSTHSAGGNRFLAPKSKAKEAAAKKEEAAKVKEAAAKEEEEAAKVKEAAAAKIKEAAAAKDKEAAAAKDKEAVIYILSYKQKKV